MLQCLHFMWVLGIRTQVLMLIQQMLWPLSHLPWTTSNRNFSILCLWSKSIFYASYSFQSCRLAAQGAVCSFILSILSPPGMATSNVEDEKQVVGREAEVCIMSYEWFHLFLFGVAELLFHRDFSPMSFNESKEKKKTNVVYWKEDN